MTLFKKVFGSHAAGSPDAPISPGQNDGFEFNESPPDEDILAKLASVTTGQAPEDIAPAEAEECVPEAEEAPETEMQVEAFAEPEPDAPSRPKPSMAELAAAAQKNIELTQQRYAAERNQNETSGPPEEKASATPPEPTVAPPEEDQSDPVLQPASPPVAAGTQRPGRSARRARTRLLGFDQGNEASTDPFDKATAKGAEQARTFPVGWFVIIAGPGKGHSFAIFSGASTIGRGEDQAIKLDFGDTSISRQNHAAVAYDDEQNKFYLGHGGKSNIIRLNDKPVLSTEELSHADILRIGETTLRFVALCGADFSWEAACNDED